MGTKSFSFLHVLLLSFFILSGCQTLKRSGSHGSDSGPVAPPVPEGPPPITTSKGMTAPVGVFLGPGGMRAFAHIGVLRALQKAKIPVVAVAGSEWGAVVGAQFAMSSKANDVEWQMMKLKKDNLPESGFFKKDLKLQSTQDLYNFLSFIFGDRDLDRGVLPFNCLTTDGDNISVVAKGKAREQLIRCVALPPFYEAYSRSSKQWVSGAVASWDWVGEMRKQGAQYFIYVDVISHGNLLGGSSGEGATKALCTALRFTSKQNARLAHLVVDVPSDKSILDFDSRKEAISAGERAIQGQIEDIIKSINL